MIHTLISTFHAGYLLNNSIFYLFNYINNDIYETRLFNTILYFLIDGIYLLKNYNKFNKQMIYHHIICLSFLCPKIIFKYNIDPNINYLIAISCLAESSTIPLNICWILNNKKLTNNIVYKINAVLTILLYIPFRLGINSYMTYYIFMNKYYIYSFIYIPFTFLNYYWFYRLLQKYLKS